MGTPNELILEYNGEQVLRFRLNPQLSLELLLKELGDGVRQSEDGFELTTNVMPIILKLNGISESHNCKLEHFELRRATLEDVFLTLTGRSMRDA